jgi:hypothetical protein
MTQISREANQMKTTRLIRNLLIEVNLRMKLRRENPARRKGRRRLSNL